MYRPIGCTFYCVLQRWGCACAIVSVVYTHDHMHVSFSAEFIISGVPLRIHFIVCVCYSVCTMSGMHACWLCCPCSKFASWEKYTTGMGSKLMAMVSGTSHA